MHLIDFLGRRGLVAAGLVVALCAPSGYALSQQTWELERGWQTGEYIERLCADAAASQDSQALDAIDKRVKEQLSQQEKRLRGQEEVLQRDQAELKRLREKYNNLKVQRARAREEIEKAQDAGQPVTVTAPLHTRLANVEKEQEDVRDAVLYAGSDVNTSEEFVRHARGTVGLMRVSVRAIQICVEKRRAVLQPPTASNPAPPGGLLAAPFMMFGSWAGACGTFAVNGTFTANVARGGAVSGRYVYAGGKTGTLSGTLGADGKLAVGSGTESGFSVRWVGNVARGAGGSSGSGTWSGSAQGLNCGGSWKSTKGQPA